MTSKKVRFLAEASLEYEAALDWYLERSETAAKRFAREIERAVAVISSAAARWPVASHGTQKYVLRRFPFAIFYRELPSIIQVVAVAHAHRRPGYWKDRA